MKVFASEVYQLGKYTSR